MPPVTGGIEGEFTGRVYPLVIGLKTGPRTMHLLGQGTTYQVRQLGGFPVLEVSEPTKDGKPNLLIVPYENVAFIAEPMFVIEGRNETTSPSAT